MARTLSDNMNIIISRRLDPKTGALVYTVNSEGSAGDPDADNEFDKGPAPVTFSVTYNKELKTETLVDDIIAGLKLAAGIK